MGVLAADQNVLQLTAGHVCLFPRVNVVLGWVREVVTGLLLAALLDPPGKGQVL